MSLVILVEDDKARCRVVNTTRREIEGGRERRRTWVDHSSVILCSAVERGKTFTTSAFMKEARREDQRLIE